MRSEAEIREKIAEHRIAYAYFTDPESHNNIPPATFARIPKELREAIRPKYADMAKMGLIGISILEWVLE